MSNAMSRVRAVLIPWLSAWVSNPRVVRLARYIVVIVVLWLTIKIAFRSQDRLTAVVYASHDRITGSKVLRMPQPTPLDKLRPRVPCYGPRGLSLSDSPDEELTFEALDADYPKPFIGSQKELGIERTWITAEDRYGPYGFGQDEDGYSRSQVDWDKVDWGELQDECYSRNADRFPRKAPSVQLKADARFSLLKDSKINPTPTWDMFNTTRRTALVIRAYSSFNYKPQVMWHLRSLITETALKTSGEYAVILLVHVQDPRWDIFASQENYDTAFAAANIPPELQSIAVLWDDSLLKSWYSAVKEHRTMWQANQPLQLFALHYPEFDHYWQLELDQRFTGDSGKYLDALAAFARNEPRKQALERSTYAFDEQLHGTYANFTAQVDKANNRETRAWGPVAVPGIVPIGPEPPTKRAQDDDFSWGVGEDADVIVTSFCADVRGSSWVFRSFIKGLVYGERTPRWWCPPAVTRVSRTLALAVHQSQHKRGMCVGSEATFPTWALWHGLKLSYPPQPAYMRPHGPGDVETGDDTFRDPGEWHNTTETPWFGSSPENSTDGLSHSNPQARADEGLTWWFTSSFPGRAMDIWVRGDTEAERMPPMMAVQDGKVYMPNFAMHPVKA